MRAFFASAFVACVAKAVLGAESPIPGYGIQIMQWEVEVAPGQVEVLNGTVQEVYAQAVQINPDFKLEATRASTNTPERGSHDKRDWVTCSSAEIGPRDAYRDRIQQGIDYLSGISGRPHIAPGPFYCSRVSCSWGSAIYWCNEQFVDQYFDNWHQITNSVGFTLISCSRGNLVRGQNREDPYWSTIVRGDDC